VDKIGRSRSYPQAPGLAGLIVGAAFKAEFMKPFTKTFTSREDRERVLAEILSQGPAVPGTTLIAYVDRATLGVLAVRSLPTPDPVLGADSALSDEEIRWLSGALCTLAQDSVPRRTRTGNRWGPITGELVTVVCREGEAEITPTEEQYFWGWRYSNHGTAALDGDVYVVTPQGWAALVGEWSDARPVLAVNADGPADVAGAKTIPEVQEAERILADASVILLDPDSGECLLCYVHRMLMEYGCNCRLRFAGHYRDVRAPRATALERRLGQSGGYCDCEVFLNGYELRLEYWLPMVIREREDEEQYPEDATGPNPLPMCREVRAGSTQPCSLWLRRGRGAW
jgi:hypothetical protein